MDEPAFWRLLDGCRAAPDLAAALRLALRQTDAATIAAFAARWEVVHLSLYGWPLWEVAYVMNGGCSDDTFEQFRDWLITLGRRAVDDARADPAAWSLSLAREHGTGVLRSASGELASYVAPELYEELTGVAVLCAKPLVGGTPYGVPFSEEQVVERNADVARVWGQFDAPPRR
jgi:hypothetical protein